MPKKLLLISNSTNYNSNFLDHCVNEIRVFLGTIEEILFVPFALHDYDAYTTMVRERFSQIDIRINGIHEVDDPIQAVLLAKAILIGGGNTFRLLKHLYDLELLDPIRRKVKQGVPYIGISAGSNVACPTIKTTNDMPIVQPSSFTALNLVPFNINPHYFDLHLSSTHQGETREQRILDFLEDNSQTVVGLREGAMLMIEWPNIVLKGSSGARIFTRGKPVQEYSPGNSLDFLLGTTLA